MSHLSLSSCVLVLALVGGAAACHAAPLQAQTSQSGLTILVGRGGGGGGGGFGGGGGRGFGGDGGFARGGEGRGIADDVYRGGRYWGGGGGYGYGYDCGAYTFGDWPRGTCDQF